MVFLRLAAIVSWLTLRIAGIVLAELSACLSVLEAAMLRGSKTVGSGGWSKILIVSLLGGILRGRLSAVALVWWLLTVLVWSWLIALLRRVALTLTWLLVALMVAWLAVLVVGT